MSVHNYLATKPSVHLAIAPNKLLSLSNKHILKVHEINDLLSSKKIEGRTVKDTYVSVLICALFGYPGTLCHEIHVKVPEV